MRHRRVSGREYFRSAAPAAGRPRGGAMGLTGVFIGEADMDFLEERAVPMLYFFAKYEGARPEVVLGDRDMRQNVSHMAAIALVPDWRAQGQRFDAASAYVYTNIVGWFRAAR